jgi:hypothetical protein
MAGRKAFPLRLSPELYEELRRWAEADFRSVNGQIEFLLQKAVRERQGRGVRDDHEPPPADGEDT